MTHERERWIEEVMSSLDAIERVTPRPDLYVSIRHRLFGPKEADITQLQWRLIAAAVALLLLLNVFAINRHIKITQVDQEHVITETTFKRSLISNYKLYEL